MYAITIIYYLLDFRYTTRNILKNIYELIVTKIVHNALLGFDFRSGYTRRIDHFESKLFPVPSHHFFFHFLTVHGIESIPGQGIMGFPDLLIDKFLVSNGPLERLFLKRVFPSSGLYFTNISQSFFVL